MAAALLTARRMHTLTALPDGRVLAAGGITGGQVWPVPGLTSAEVYDPVSGAWTPTGAMAVPRHGHSATVLTDGRVLVADGEHVRSAHDNITHASAEIYDPHTGVRTATAPMAEPRWNHQAVLLHDGRVLVIGAMVSVGRSRSTHLALCELYDPSAGVWAPTGTLYAPGSSIRPCV